MERIHGRLLMATGVVHTLGAFIPGIFGTQFVGFAQSGFFSISDGIAAFPLFGGQFNYENFAAFWFFYAGPLMILSGYAIDSLERIGGYVPRRLAICFLVVSLVGAYMIPFSGMTLLLLPQAMFALVRGERGKIEDVADRTGRTVGDHR